jgi:iron(III) transport system permease protein
LSTSSVALRPLWLTGPRVQRYLFSGAILAALGYLIVYPIGMLVYASVVDVPPRPGEPVGHLTGHNFAPLFAGGNLQAIRNSVVIGVAGTALALAIGCALAWLTARTDMPARWLGQVSAITPLFLSPFVGALAWSFLAGPRVGYLNVFLQGMGAPFGLNVFSLGGLVFVLGLYHAPYAYLFVSSALTLINPELEEAGKAHGATGWQVARRITFPLVRPALLGAATLTLVLIIENFPIPEVLGTTGGVLTVPVQIFRLMEMYPSNPNEASAFGVVLLLFLSLLLFAQARLLRGRDFATVTGKGFRPRQLKLGKWRWVAFAFVLLYLVGAVLLPLWALAMRALSKFGYFLNSRSFVDFGNMTFKNFSDTLSYSTFTDALRNTVFVAVATAVFGGALHYLIAHVVHRTRLPGRRVVEYVTMAPIAIPGVVIGLGYLWAWIRLPWPPLFGSLWIFVLAYSARLAPFGFRTMSATIGQLHHELEESARVCGAGRVRTVRSITLPLLRPGVVSMLLLLFIMSFHELSVSIFLYTPNTQVVTVVLYQAWSDGNTARVAVISLVTSGLLLLVALVGRRWLKFREA